MFNVELPTRNEIDKLKGTYHPPVMSQEIKCSVDYIDLVKDTVKGLFVAENIAMANSNFTSDEPVVIELTAKTGLDGSGCHRARHQRVNYELSMDENPHIDPKMYTNYLLCSMSPLALNLKSNDGNVLL